VSSDAFILFTLRSHGQVHGLSLYVPTFCIIPETLDVPAVPSSDYISLLSINTEEFSPLLVTLISASWDL
jgi:hypothetical protein